MPKSIVLATEVPGPRSRALGARRASAVARGVSNLTPVFAATASGATVTDVDGNTFLDFTGGIGTLNVGHSHPAVVAAAAAQLRKFTHTCWAVAMYEPYLELAETLNRITPGAFAKKTVLFNSGAEATENAVKIARHATGRPAVVVFEHAFHGRTLLALSMTSKVKPYKTGFGPFASEIYRLPFPYEYRLGQQDAATYGAELAEFFSTHVDPDRVACVIMELVLGEGGFVPAPAAFVDELLKVCRAHGILFVADEVQTGFCRTGKMFASAHYDLEPDLVVLAKSLGGGLPLSAVVGRAEVMDSAQVGGLGGTYAGNPVACAAALAVIAILEEQRLDRRAAAIGEAVAARCAEWQRRFAIVGDARGLGAMRAIELVKDRATKEPDKERTGKILKRCYETGLLAISAGTYGNIIRALMPLIISDEQLAEGLDVLERALEANA
jgi:4-aminobutyrate aminotransferase / (S)-3-amino-2-methylpropionate transaminase / 5-aminovalerate transaminase